MEKDKRSFFAASGLAAGFSRRGICGFYRIKGIARAESSE
jgi:hypothetical protein